MNTTLPPHVITAPGEVDDKPKETDAPPAEDDAEGEVIMDEDDFSVQAARQAQVKEDLALLASGFSEEQRERYSIYRESALPGKHVKKIIQSVRPNMSLTPTVIPLVGGVAKVFVGEIIERARKVQAERGETGALSPDHMREAYRLYSQENGRIGTGSATRGKSLFTR